MLPDSSIYGGRSGLNETETRSFEVAISGVVGSKKANEMEAEAETSECPCKNIA
jgi:hypothetical protein